MWLAPRGCRGRLSVVTLTMPAPPAGPRPCEEDLSQQRGLALCDHLCDIRPIEKPGRSTRSIPVHG